MLYTVSEISHESDISILQFPLCWLVLELIRCIQIMRYHPMRGGRGGLGPGGQGIQSIGPNHQVMNQTKALKQHEDV